MKKARKPWKVVLTAAAEADFADIVRWADEHVGPRQARIYAGILSGAIEALSAGPSIPGTRAMDDIARDVHSLHVSRMGRRGRHFILFRPAAQERIEVLRLLHDAMDRKRYISAPA